MKIPPANPLLGYIFVHYNMFWCSLFCRDAFLYVEMESKIYTNKEGLLLQ